jgi:GNAT superfamily N-acetyltransferase
MKPLPHGCFQRRLSPADEPALLEFFHSHSKETVFQRYHYLFSEMTHKRAMSLLGVDQHRDVALAIFEMTTSGEAIHAIARYYTEPTGQVAELAFVVRESKRRLGFATRLLHELGKVANAHALLWLRAQVLQDNYPMRALLHQYATQTHPMPYADVIEYVIPVASLTSPRAHSIALADASTS